MTSLGETLRRARLERKLELNRIADELKISASMLKAIEEERFDKLPGGVFARSFVRQYARLLELDESEIEGELTRVLEPAPEMPQATHAAAHSSEHEIPLPRVAGWQAVGDPVGRWSSSALALGLVVLVMLACAGAYAWWQHERRPVAHRNGPPAAAAPARQAPAPETAAAAVPTPAAPAPTPQPTETLPAATPQPAPEQTSATPVAAPAVNTEIAPPIANAAVRVEVTAQEATWISVRSDGKYLFSGILEPNQSHSVAANQTVWLRVGNAAGVEIRLNGNPIGSIGGSGLVRTLQFTSGGFQILPPDVPKPAPPTDPPNPL